VIEESYHKINHYFYRLAYSEKNESFEEACLNEDLLKLQSKSRSRFCDCCKKRENGGKMTSTSLNGIARPDGSVESIIHRGISYEVHDFVYLTPKNANEPYIIAQITTIKLDGFHRWRLNPDLKNVSVQIGMFMLHYIQLCQTFNCIRHSNFRALRRLTRSLPGRSQGWIFRNQR
jgi:hypothetical protein